MYIFDLVRFCVFCFVYLYLFTFNGVLIPTEVYLSQYISRSKDCYWFQQLYVFTKLKYKDLQRENILKICMYTFDKKKDCLEIRRRRHSKYQTGMCHKLDSCADRNLCQCCKRSPLLIIAQLFSVCQILIPNKLNKFVCKQIISSHCNYMYMYIFRYKFPWA